MRLHAGADSEVGDDKEKEDDEGTDTDRPTVADAPDEVRHDDGEDDAADAGPRGEDAEGGATILAEPAADAVQGW